MRDATIVPQPHSDAHDASSFPSPYVHTVDHARTLHSTPRLSGAPFGRHLRGHAALTPSGTPPSCTPRGPHSVVRFPVAPHHTRDPATHRNRQHLSRSHAPRHASRRRPPTRPQRRTTTPRGPRPRCGPHVHPSRVAVRVRIATATPPRTAVTHAHPRLIVPPPRAASAHSRAHDGARADVRPTTAHNVARSQAAPLAVVAVRVARRGVHVWTPRHSLSSLSSFRVPPWGVPPRGRRDSGAAERIVSTRASLSLSHTPSNHSHDAHTPQPGTTPRRAPQRTRTTRTARRVRGRAADVRPHV